MSMNKDNPPLTAEENTQEAEVQQEPKPRKKSRKKPLRLPPEQWEMVKEIAAQLGETEKGPRYLIADILTHCGIEFTQEVLKETFEVEAKGGLMTNNQTRRRTIGGVFFYLAKGRLDGEMRSKVFPDRRKQEQVRQLRLTPFKWEERARVLEKIHNQGVVDDVRVTLIGYPGEIVKRQNLIVTKMQHNAPMPSLPKGVPPIPEEHNTEYTVYIGYEQWGKVEKNLSADKVLIVEGLSIYDAEIPGIAVFATAVKTKRQKTKQVAENAEPASADDAAKPAPKAERKGRAKTTTAAPEETPEVEAEARPVQLPPMPEVVIPEGAPANVQQKLHELHSAAQQFREKIAVLEAKPANQRFGLEMTQKLLVNTEKQIESLVAKYS